MTTPGCNISICVKLRPFRGRALTVRSSTACPSSADELCSCTAAAMTSTVSVTAPICMGKSKVVV